MAGRACIRQRSSGLFLVSVKGLVRGRGRRLVWQVWAGVCSMNDE